MALSEFKTSPLFGEREQSALAYAEAMNYQDQRPTADHFKQLRRHFDEDAIIELTGLIAFQNMSGKFNTALGVESQGFCAIPAREKQIYEQLIPNSDTSKINNGYEAPGSG
jgi:hypothetical protein